MHLCSSVFCETSTFSYQSQLLFTMALVVGDTACCTVIVWLRSKARSVISAKHVLKELLYIYIYVHL